MTEIRDERPTDVDAVRAVNREAFGQEHEGRLVDRLRDRSAVILSLVAIVDESLVGHVLFSPVHVGTRVGAGLGPLAVRPSYQRRGIGSQLVEHGLARLRDLGSPFVVVLGHPTYYPRFGFTPAAALGLTCDWDVPADVFMVKVLSPRVADGLNGRVVYQPEFSATDEPSTHSG